MSEQEGMEKRRRVKKKQRQGTKDGDGFIL